jgi:hypothetical protein
MIMQAQKRATGEDSVWISAIQEEAFALATEQERRQAVLMIEQHASQ